MVLRGKHEPGKRFGWSEAKALLRRFWPYLKPERPSARIMALLQVLAIPSGVASPLLVQHLFDVAVPALDRDEILRLCLWILALTLSSHVLRTIAALIVVGMKARVRHRLVIALQQHVLRLPASYFHATETGYVMARVREDVQALDGIMLDRIVDVFVDGFRAVLFLVMLLWVDAGLALAGLVLFAIVALGVFAMSGPLRRRSALVQETDAVGSASLHQAISGIALVHTTVQESAESRRLSRAVRATVRAIVKLGRLHVGVGYTIGLAMSLGTYVILGVGAWRVVDGSSSIGSLIAFSILLTYVAGAVTALMQLNPEFQRGLAALERIFKLKDEAREAPLEPIERPTRIAGSVTFERVSVVYPDGTQALTEVDLDVKPGEVVALVGRSGAGKSSLVSLIPRLLDPSAGVVRIDGVDARHLDLRTLRASIGVVPQDVFLFNRTVRENVAYARPDASDAEIQTALRDAHAEAFVARLKDGLQTLVGERGVKLSGGEKQRLALAREILRDPPILILDEATSSLDSESEAAIRAAIERLKKDRTCFLIAHRLSTVMGADRIVVLDHGRIVEQGPHAALLARRGLYAHLYETQFRGIDGE
ncbi:MAG: ABC transporter ATP-binding protein [Planctomycetes bacterium]|nr:ABC transporter ATP-binding protein [Planctomycetota bacterium]MCC7170591.1 ABC transporter ATP-binding protein [Planctomycetota bacterium]